MFLRLELAEIFLRCLILRHLLLISVYKTWEKGSFQNYFDLLKNVNSAREKGDTSQIFLDLYLCQCWQKRFNWKLKVRLSYFIWYSKIFFCLGINNAMFKVKAKKYNFGFFLYNFFIFPLLANNFDDFFY